MSALKQPDPLANVERVGVILIVLFTAVSAFMGGWPVILGTAAGGAFAFANFRLLRTIVGRVFLDPDRLKPAYFALLVPKFAVIAAIVWMIVATEWLNIIAFAAGTTSLLIALMIAPFMAGNAVAAEEGSAKSTEGLGDSE